MSTPVRIALVGLGIFVGVARVSTEQQAPSLQVVLERAGAYLADYQRQVSAVVSEELYDQVARTGSVQVSERRKTRSDVLVIANERTGWVVFRDVFEVDGKPLRDRDERLEKLLLKPDADTYLQARRIAEESARFNVNFRGRTFGRTLNNPMATLRYLALQNQHRSRFKVERTTSVDGAKAIELRFDEQQKPRILASPDQAAGGGRFWLDPVSGRVLRSELSIQTLAWGLPIVSNIKVTFALEPRIGVSVPVAMEESYRLGAFDGQSIEARATYSRFRKFSVDVSTILKNQN